MHLWNSQCAIKIQIRFKMHQTQSDDLFQKVQCLHLLCETQFLLFKEQNRILQCFIDNPSHTCKIGVQQLLHIKNPLSALKSLHILLFKYIEISNLACLHVLDIIHKISNIRCFGLLLSAVSFNICILPICLIMYD